MTRDSFIARWSRLKGAAAQPDAAAETPPAPAESAPAELAPAELAPAESAPLSPEEIAALPPVETLTPLSDITPYLRRGVPALLRNAAMRRMWALNPAIRDYVDDAMEYAMDWNTPGAILGNGPLTAGDDALAMARKVMGAARESAPEAVPEATDAPTQATAAPRAVAGQGDEHAATPQAASQAASQADSQTASQTASPTTLEATRRTTPPQAVAAPAQAAQSVAPEAGRAAASRRRHGGAAPS